MNDATALRIAVVLQTPGSAHSAVYIGYDELRTVAQALGHSVEIVVPEDFPLMRRISGRLVPLVYPALVARWMRHNRQRFDLVVFHSYAGWACADSRRVGGARTLVALHGLEPLYHRALRAAAAAEGRALSWRYRFLQERLMPAMLRAACRKATAVTCLNGLEADYLTEHGWVPAARVHIVPHGIPPLFFTGPRSAAGASTWLFVGQWLPMKGIRYLRDAMVDLLGRHADMRLICAGTLEGAATVLADFPAELHGRVEVHPRVDQQELAGIYRRADGFVFPSLSEGFSRALVEAMASGLPMVTTNVGGARDALRDGISALILQPQDPASIVSAIERLRSDPALAARLGRAASEAAGAYRLEDRQQQMIDLLVGLAAGPA